MSEALRLAGFALTGALIAFALKAVHKQAGMAAALAAGMILFFSAVTRLSQAAEMLQALSRQAGLGDDSLTLLMKMLGMAYISEFAVQACRDAGEEGLAMKMALCGKMLMMGQTLPLIGEIGQLTLSLTQ